MHRTRAVGGVVLIATGLVWIGQGTGLLRGQSFMVGDPVWAWLGLLAVAVGGTFMFLGLRGSR
ncbi:MAG TPA: hypothetical protein VKB00_01555 [Candidatus Limnocylindrales bacterium]|jgi:hypothetical protein|nr:hypothetical protein [Candidatus Limnocylindrales bacterium]